MSTLPFQVDELIATLNSTNIGTEALEIAKLQAQLQQALQAYPQGAPFPTSPVQSAYTHAGAAPTNTPTARTPSGSAWFVDATHPHRRRRSSSAASIRQRRSETIREEEEVYWRHIHGNSEMDQDVMEDVEEEAQVDESLYSASSHHSASPTFGSSPTTYALTDPFLAQQLQAAEQRSRQPPSFFAQIATAQQHSSPFFPTAQQHQHQPQPPFPGMSVDSQPASIFPPSSRPGRHTLTIDTGPRLVDAAHLR